MDIRETLKRNQQYLAASDSALRLETAEYGQHPYAIVVCCSDSRVIPKQFFSASIGELFVIRVAVMCWIIISWGASNMQRDICIVSTSSCSGIQAAGRFRRLCPEAETASFSTSPMKSWKPSERNETRIRRVS